MEVRRKVLIFLSALVGGCIGLLGPAFAGEGAASGEVQRCLECHAGHDIIKQFENGETLNVHVSPEKFAASVHRALACSDCHGDFSGAGHPQRRFRSREQFRIKSSLACRKCHSLEKIKTRAIHVNILREEEEGRSHPCADCHGSHSVMPVSRKRFSNEEQYCLKCHGHALSMEFKNGETVSLYLDSGLLNTSVHRKLSCSDCHFGFSDSQHPQRNFKSARAFSVANAETCRRCHFDKYTKTAESIHYLMLSQGNLNAPVCTDCHGFHTMPQFAKERRLIARRCQKCHPGIYDIYAKSVHGKALLDDASQDVPVCIDCHTAHDIKNPLTLDYRERIPEMCSNCHGNKTIVSKYGLSTDVVKTYLSDFHGVTLGFYRKQREGLNKPTKQMAVCTDCHGTHNIISVRSTDPALVKANLVKRCQQCHRGATKNFPDSWLSHYRPSPLKTPLIFVVNAVYTAFIPIMIIGLVLQILLHIWRYAVNR
ncbi:MAG TPA: cytochrome c3 family protein [Thermodesulfovibrionales bacterium]|nr:cytochrome c3 family protein [Thermodesulfovibrionales bacterium]